MLSSSLRCSFFRRISLLSTLIILTKATLQAQVSIDFVAPADTTGISESTLSFTDLGNTNAFDNGAFDEDFMTVSNGSYSLGGATGALTVTISAADKNNGFDPYKWSMITPIDVTADDGSSDGSTDAVFHHAKRGMGVSPFGTIGGGLNNIRASDGDAILLAFDLSDFDLSDANIFFNITLSKPEEEILIFERTDTGLGTLLQDFTADTEKQTSDNFRITGGFEGKPGIVEFALVAKPGANSTRISSMEIGYVEIAEPGVIGLFAGLICLGAGFANRRGRV